MSGATRPKVILGTVALAAACGSFGGTARGGGDALAPDFSPNPTILEVPLRKGQFDQLGLSAHGFGKCGSTGETTPSPAATFTLAEATDDLELRYEGSKIVERGVLVAPGGAVTCLTAGKSTDLGTWPAGTYGYFPHTEYANQEPGTTRLILTAPRRAQRESQDRFRDELRPSPSANPTYAEVAPQAGPPVLAANAGIGACAKGGRHVVPVAKLVVEKPSTFGVQIGGAEQRRVFVRTPDGGCAQPGEGGVKLEPGAHQVWLQVDRDADLPATWEVALFEIEAAVNFGEAPTHALQSKPVTVLTKTGDAALRGRPACGQGQRAPAFYLRHEGKEAPKVSILHATEPAQLRLAGPIEMQFDGGLRCGDKPGRAGTYAVWVDAPTGTEAVVLAGDPKGTDPLATVRDVPSQIPLAQREYGRYYAYYGAGEGLPVEALFAAAPAQLFVFPTRAIKGMSAGEPVLLVDHGDTESVVATLAGRQRTVRTADLGAKPPGSVALPQALPTLTAPKKISWYYARGDLANVAGPGERHIVDAYEKERDVAYRCVREYKKKHDPTLGKNYDLVDLRTGKTLGSKVAKAAHRTCGFDKLLAKAERLPDKVVSARLTARKAALAALRTKFK